MSPPENIDISSLQQNLLIGGLEAAEACSDLGITHVVTVDTIVPEADSYSSVVNVFESNIQSLFTTIEFLLKLFKICVFCHDMLVLEAVQCPTVWFFSLLPSISISQMKNTLTF